jgi:hypothetical protein
MDFFERDAKDAVDLMKVSPRKVLRGGRVAGPVFVYFNFVIISQCKGNTIRFL